MTVARRRVVASRPDQSAASLTSPWSLTHSASTPSGTRSWGMPGATLTQASRRSRPSTNGHGGVQSSTSKVRPRPVLRAGSANATSKGPVSIAVASATITAPARPSAARLASATATRSGSRSTPAQMMPARAVAIRSPPMPQPRSTTVRVEAAVSRAARWAATGRRVACSRPSGVKYIRAASVAELLLRPAAQRDLGEGSGDVGRLRRTPQLGLGAQRVLGGLGGPGEQVLAVVGQQPPEGVEVHRASLAAARRGGRRGARSPIPVVCLALREGEC